MPNAPYSIRCAALNQLVCTEMKPGDTIKSEEIDMLKREASNVFWLVVLLGVPIYFWLWAVGTKLQSDNIKLSPILLAIFKLSIVYPIIYLGFAICYLVIEGSVGMPFHMAAMFSTFFAMIFAAKSLKSAELKKEASFQEYIGDFFLFWFYPIGIWSLQPRIYKLINK